MNTRQKIMLSAALAVSPAALFALPALSANAQAPALAQPLPVYASATPKVIAVATPYPLPIRPVPITTQPTLPSR